ncbi:MAG: hypothetical protein ACE149_15890 [Armatimonadota bacterium]
MTRTVTLTAVVGTLLAIVTTACAGGPAAVRLWDTVTPVRAEAELAARAGWRAFPAGVPEGDLVVETDALTVTFAAHLGKVLMAGKADPRLTTELRPTELLGKQATLALAVAERDGRPTIRAAFRAADGGESAIMLSLTSDRILAIVPEEATRAVALSAPIEVAIVPSILGEDLIYDPKDYPAAQMLSLPSEHFLIGLLRGENSMLVATWQEEAPAVRLLLDHGGDHAIGAVNLAEARGLSLALLEAPGIWHRQSLGPSMLERDIAIGWRPPFPAIWLTQLLEDEVKTTFEFREGRDRQWRGSVGYYDYPVYFSRGETMLSLGKKIPPEGDAIIYFLERSDDTPVEPPSPIDVAQRTLNGDVLAGILEVEGRPAWFPERPNAVLGAATCAVTDALKEIFDAGQEVEKRELVRGGVEDMYFYLEHMQERDARFPVFARDMLSYLDAQQQAAPELAAYLNEMRGIAQEIVDTYDHARDTIRDMKYAHELGDRTIALAAERRPDNPQRMADLKQDWTGMGGALEHLACREHTLTRKLYQQAAYLAATNPAAMPVAEEIRRRAKRCLAKPESYEIWANY